jgi:nucleotide-binding universal stress UspA family protein
MLTKIVVGLSNAETSHVAAREAADLAKATGAELHFVTAVSKSDSAVVAVGSDSWETSTVTIADQEATAFVAGLGLSTPHTVTVLYGAPGAVLVDEATRIHADLIVVGNVRMQGAGRVLGSVGQHVIHRAECNVLVVKTV